MERIDSTAAAGRPEGLRDETPPRIAKQA